MENIGDLLISATRNKFRFSSKKGQVSTEDLWDLSLTELDSIAKGINRSVKEAEEESFINTKTNFSKKLEEKLEIVKFVISVKIKEKEDRENAVARKAQKEKIMGIIAEKESESLKNMDLDSLKKMITEL